MQVTVFLASGWHGFTRDESGANLPAEHGPWQKFKIVNMNRSEVLRVAVDTDAALDAIQKDGFYLQSSRA